MSVCVSVCACARARVCVCGRRKATANTTDIRAHLGSEEIYLTKHIEHFYIILQNSLYTPTP